MHQLLHRRDGALWLAQVILAHKHQLAPMHPAGLVELIEVDLNSVHGELAVNVDRARERAKRAHLYFAIGDPWNVSALRLRLERGDGGKGKSRGDCRCKSLHLGASRVSRSARAMRQTWLNSTSREGVALAEPPARSLDGEASPRWGLASLGRRQFARQICRKARGLSIAGPAAGGNQSGGWPRCSAISRLSRSRAAARNRTSYFPRSRSD